MAGPWTHAVAHQALADDLVDTLAQRVARRHQPGIGAFFRREREPARGGGAREIVGFHLGDVGTELLERLADIAREARLDGGLQRRIALAHDLVHGRGLHALPLELREGFSGIDRVELLLVADQHHPGNAQRIGDPQEVAGLDGGGERALVDHERSLRERRSHLLLALACHASFGHAVVAHQKPLQGLAADPGLAFQRARRRGRWREAPDRVTLLFQQRPGSIQHGGLAASGVALDPDHAVVGREDQLHGPPSGRASGDRCGAPCRRRGRASAPHRGPGRSTSARWSRARRRRRGRW